MGVSSKTRGSAVSVVPTAAPYAVDRTGSPVKPAEAAFAPHGVTRPYRFSLILAAAVFVGEALIMFTLHWLPPMPLWTEVLVDAGMITLIVLPLIHRFMLRPMLAQIAAWKDAQTQLEHSNLELRALSQVERHQRQLAEALSEATAALNTSLNLEEVLDRILEQTQRVVPCPAMAVLLFRGDWVTIPRHRDWPGPQQVLTDGFPLAMFPLLRELATTPRPQLIADTRVDSSWPEIPGLEQVRSLVLAPLVEDGHTIGYLITLSDQPNYFQPEMMESLVTFAAYAAVALHHANIYEAEQRARQRAETLSDASLALTQTLELQAVLDVLLQYLHRLIPFGIGSTVLLESEAQLVVAAQLRFDARPDQQSIVPVAFDLSDHPHFAKLIGRQQSTLVQTRAEALAWAPGLVPDGELSCLAVPIVAGGRALGFCCLEKDAANCFTLEDMRLTEAVVGQAAVAIQNAWLFQQVRAGHDRLQSLSHRLVQIQENERLYVARELHDEAGQMLSSLMLGLKLLEKNTDEPKVLAGVRELRQVTNTVQENLHRLAMDLRPASLDHLGLVAALRAFIKTIHEQDGVAVQFKVSGWEETRLAAEVEVCLYRIAQEALTNIVRHAQATSVDVLLQKSQDDVILTVEDDGIGFDPEIAKVSTQLGLVGMRERCEMLGGNLVVESAPGIGTTIVAEIPYVDSNPDL